MIFTTQGQLRDAKHEPGLQFRCGDCGDCDDHQLINVKRKGK